MTCSTAITPDSPKTDSLIMEDEHLDTIPDTKSDEFIKSSVEDLVQNPSDSEDERECDVPDCDDSSSSDDESSHEAVIHEMSFKTFSNPLFNLDEEIISSEFDPIHNEDLDSTPKNVRFDAESYLLEPLVNRDTLMASPPKIDFLLDEFTAFQDNSNTIIESLPTFPIPVEDSDSLREEIDIFSGSDNSIQPGIESDDFDSEDDNNSTSLPEFDSFHVDYPDSGDSTINVVEDIPVDIYDPGICIKVESTRFLAPLSPVIDTLLLFSSENEDKVFNHSVLAYKEKSPLSSSHRGFKASKLSLHKSPMLIHGNNTPNLGVRHPHFYPPLHAQVWGDWVKLSDLKQALRRPGFLKPLVLAVFVLRSQELQILSFILGIRYPNLID
ncbi:hypothetical protein Tco_1416806 [Tanacetum coccineum]